MIAKLLTLTGTLTLAGAVAAAGYWAVGVYGQQPALPDLSVPDREASNSDDTTPKPTARRMRPDVFYTAMLERPLFAPSRRPLEDAPEPEPVVEQEEEVRAPAPEPERARAPDVGLLGVMGNDDANSALVALDEAEPVWVKPGTPIAGWTVAAIGPDWLELTLDSETIRIEMYQR